MDTPLNLSERDLFHLVLIDRIKKVKTSITLKDSDGDEIPLKETVGKLTQYIIDKMSDEGENACRSQVVPLMSQAVAGGLIKLMGQSNAIFLLSDHTTRMSLIYMMSMSFYLLKWIQQKNIKISTTEEALTDEDIEMYDRVSRASDLTVKYTAAGGDPKTAIREMMKRGLIQKEDLASLGAEDMENEPEDETKVDSGNKSN